MVACGAWIALAAWIAWPAWHLWDAWRPLRRMEGAPAVAGLAVTLALAGWLLTHTPEPPPAAAHRAGQIAVRVVLTLAAVLGLTSFGIGWAGPGAVLVDIISFPVVLTALVLGFAYVGRLHRMAGQLRMANLSDLVGVVLPLLWAASQMLSGYPGPPLWGTAALAMSIGAASLASLALRFTLPDRDAPGTPTA